MVKVDGKMIKCKANFNATCVKSKRWKKGEKIKSKGSQGEEKERKEDDENDAKSAIKREKMTKSAFMAKEREIRVMFDKSEIKMVSKLFKPGSGEFHFFSYLFCTFPFHI